MHNIMSRIYKLNKYGSLAHMYEFLRLFIANASIELLLVVGIVSQPVDIVPLFSSAPTHNV